MKLKRRSFKHSKKTPLNMTSFSPRHQYKSEIIKVNENGNSELKYLHLQRQLQSVLTEEVIAYRRFITLLGKIQRFETLFVIVLRDFFVLFCFAFFIPLYFCCITGSDLMLGK